MISALRIFHRDGGDSPVFHLDIRQFALKADIRPPFDKLFTEIFQHHVEIIGAHMGLGVHQNVLRGAVLHQLLQDKAVADVLGAGIELAVGKGTGAALAELDVGDEVQHTCGPEPLHVLRPLLHAAAPLQ